MTAPNYTGTLIRGETPDTVVGTLVDSFGWVIRITGRRAPDGRGYVLEGMLGETPPALLLPIVDDAAPVEVAPKTLGTGRYWTDGHAKEDAR